MTEQAQKRVDSVIHSDKTVRRPLTQRSLERMRLPRGFWKAEIARISEGEHKRPILRYIRRVDEAVEDGYGVVLWGKNDVGKTGTAAVVLKEARRKGHSCLFLTAYQYLAEHEGGSSFDDTHSVLERCELVDMLVLDDFGKETSKHGIAHGKNEKYAAKIASVARVFEHLVRTRQSNRRATIITTNLDPGALKERYGTSFTRLFAERFGVIEVVGPSQREIERNQTVRFFSDE